MQPSQPSFKLKTMLPEDRVTLIAALVDNGDVSSLYEASSILKPAIGASELVALTLAIKLQRRQAKQVNSGSGAAGYGERDV